MSTQQSAAAPDQVRRPSWPPSVPGRVTWAPEEECLGGCRKDPHPGQQVDLRSFPLWDSLHLVRITWLTLLGGSPRGTYALLGAATTWSHVTPHNSLPS